MGGRERRGGWEFDFPLSSLGVGGREETVSLPFSQKKKKKKSAGVENLLKRGVTVFLLPLFPFWVLKDLLTLEEKKKKWGGGKGKEEGGGANPIACPEPFQKGEGGRKQSVGSNVFQMPTYGKKTAAIVFLYHWT